MSKVKKINIVLPDEFCGRTIENDKEETLFFAFIGRLTQCKYKYTNIFIYICFIIILIKILILIIINNNFQYIYIFYIQFYFILSIR